tara:strand:+ start:2042 stop:2212 length:171 start_codon:yes stop_codon:yes gene_type:complete
MLVYVVTGDPAAIAGVYDSKSAAENHAYHDYKIGVYVYESETGEIVDEVDVDASSR